MEHRPLSLIVACGLALGPAGCTVRMPGEEPEGESICRMELPSDDLPDVTVRYPRSWRVSDPDAPRCRYFDRGNPDVVPGTAPPVAVRTRIVRRPFEELARSGETLQETARHRSTIDGRRALRLQGTVPAPGQPGGSRRTQWLVDLRGRHEETPGTLIASSSETATDDYAGAVELLDDLVRRVRVGLRPSGPCTPLHKWSHEGVPYRVVWFERCLGLIRGTGPGERVDETCGLSPEGPLAVAVLQDHHVRVAVGVTQPTVEVAELYSQDVPTTAVATVPLQDASLRGFAIPLSARRATLVAGTFMGERLATRAVGGSTAQR